MTKDELKRKIGKTYRRVTAGKGLEPIRPGTSLRKGPASHRKA